MAFLSITKATGSGTRAQEKCGSVKNPVRLGPKFLESAQPPLFVDCSTTKRHRTSFDGIIDS